MGFKRPQGKTAGWLGWAVGMEARLPLEDQLLRLAPGPLTVARLRADRHSFKNKPRP